MPSFIKRLRWSRLSPTGKKIAIGAGAATTLGAIIFLATRKKKSLVETTLDKLTAAHAPIPYLSTIKGKIEAAKVAENLDHIFQVMTGKSTVSAGEAFAINGSFVFVNDEAFRTIFVHQGDKALDLVAGLFYPGKDFSTDEISNHAHCQTNAARVVQLGNEWSAIYYVTVYRYPSPNPIYAGNAIDPHADPQAFDDAVQSAMRQRIYGAMEAADVATTVTKFTQIFGGPQVDLGAANGLFLIEVPTSTRDLLARLGRDMAAKNNKALPTTGKDGQPIPEPMLSNLHASVGAGVVAHLIDSFETTDSKTNPCVRDLDAGLVFEMFAATLGTVITLAIGPALSGIGTIVKIATTINKLAELGK